MADVPSWTTYPELNAVLALLVSGSRELLCDGFVGAYLHGSLAAGDFNPRTSDVDFAVVTNSPVHENLKPGLCSLMAELLESDPRWASRLEGSFMPAAGFADGDDGAAYPSFDEGKFVLDHKGTYNAIQRHTLREHGVVLAGPTPAAFISPVSPKELKAETLRVLLHWWKPQMTNTQYLRERNYQAYAVLTMCRVLYTLTSGAVATKPQAARWAAECLDARWLPLIARAVAWEPGENGIDDLDATLKLIAHVVAIGEAATSPS